ncbi:hypothetical protein STAFG_8685 [Streptomyces afghaniensis 772]|uniref:Uncharacterized protein n=1 Tax=Streptomyces afghaniensis 772 TaxID=1283301 RepID=S4MD44_9ACTN|nr:MULTISPECIES: hypothetical protein [Streptomyces]EPJ34276.1 hypothetical protein STAFG_8685 [Streptomyces afghaniensis 772]UOB09334.1 hypothetical protein MQE23_09805 [Streptomyces sp. HP-A2021]
MTGTAERVHRALTDVEMAAITAAVDAVGSVMDLVPATARALYTALAPGAVATAEADPGRADPPRARFAIPETQWLAIAETCLARAEAFGAGVHAALELHRVMPARYPDPEVTVAPRPRGDHRPPVHELSVTREAADTIGAASRHCERLASYFGHGSREHTEAVRSWQGGLSQLFAMSFGARTRIERADELSLTVTSETTGFVHGLHFRPHPGPRPAPAPQPGRWESVF